MELYIKGIGILSAAGSNVDQDFPGDVLPENFLCKEPDYTPFIPPMQLRRMSKAVRMGIGASKIALQQAAIDKPDALSIGTAMGCLSDTETFLSRMVDQDEQMLTPTAFIQSTHNTVGGQIALLHGCNGHNLTYVHRGHSFEHAMINAYLYLQAHPQENMLVGGIDELTPTSEAIWKRFGVEKNGEGAGFFVVNVKDREGVCIRDINTFTTGDANKVTSSVNRFLERTSLNRADIDCVVLGAKEEDDVLYGALKNELFPGNKMLVFKNRCGDYGTASAFAIGMIAGEMKKNSWRNVLLVTNFLDSWSCWWLSRPS